MIKSGWKAAAAAASAALLLAASAQAVVIEGGEATGAPGDTVDVSVSLDTEGASVAGTENVLGYNPTDVAVVAKTTNSRPDCAVNEAINKGGTAFAFQPTGCGTETACTAVKALVLALDNVDPIADGSVLYTCKVAIASGATAGDKTLSITAPGASDPAGGALSTTGVDGRVIVTGGAADADIIVGNASGDAGDTVDVTTSLDTGASVAGTENVIEYAAPLTIAARTSNGRPDCTVNEAINKGGTAFAFQPSGCGTETPCTAVKALVLALDNVDAIPDGSALYTCKVNIAGDAENGDYPLTCSAPGASDPAGGALIAACTSGTVTVGGVEEPTATPTNTPVVDTPTPEATATVTATPTNTRRPTNTPGGGGGNDDDGCAVVAPAQSSNAWMLLLPAAALLWVRRRTR